MEDTQFPITFNGMEPSRATLKAVAKQIQKWIERDESLLWARRRQVKTVHLSREDYRYYTCQIEAWIGSGEWQGFAEGRSIHEAVRAALQNMKPKLPADLPLNPFWPITLAHSA